MKHLALLAIMALTLSACGEKAEKKVEGQAATQMEQQKNDQAAPAEPAAPAPQSTEAPAASDSNAAAATDAAKPE